MIRRILFAVSLAIALGGCAGESQDPERRPANGEFGGPVEAPGNKDQSACYIYPLYSVGSCEALIKRSSLTGSVKTDYTYPSSSDSRYRAPVNLIDLTKISLNAQITKNFRLSEFMATHKGRYGYFAEHVFGYLQGIRDRLAVPVRINSGYRSPGYNKKIGGARLSRHMYGDGVDLGGTSTSKLQSGCRAAGASYIQVYSDGHVHCDWRSRSLDDTFVPGAAGVTLSALEVSAMSEPEFAKMQEAIGGKPVIAMNGDAALGSKVEFSASIELQEDPGELLTEWIVVSPDGQGLEAEGSLLEVELAQRGQYQVRVRVGGYAESVYTLFVE